MAKKLIWDLPTRLFHWLLVLSIGAQYVTAELLDDAMQWHFYFGYFTLGLVLFRLIWGLIGTKYARFSQFLSGPVSVIKYAQSLPDKNAKAHTGHNPLGGWAVIAMLLLVAVQAVSGLFLTDDVFLDGPYHHLVGETVLDIAEAVHHTGFDILLIVIAVHIIAIVFYKFYKRQQLVPPMIHGMKDTASSGIRSSRTGLAILIALICAALLYYAIVVAPPAPATEALYY